MNLGVSEVAVLFDPEPIPVAITAFSVANSDRVQWYSKPLVGGHSVAVVIHSPNHL